MLKLTTLLCGSIFLAMLIGGRNESQARYGLEGKFAPLRLEADKHEQPADEQVAETPQITRAARPAAAVAPEPAPASLATLTQAAPSPAALVDASYESGTQDALSGSLPLTMPLVQPAGETVMPDESLPDESATGGNDGTGGIIAYVSGASVNVRSGPSAQTDAVAQLDRGEAVLILPSETPGWSMIRIEGDGVTGYVASRFLSQTGAAESGPSGD